MTRIVELDSTDFEDLPEVDRTYVNVTDHELAVPLSASQIAVLAPNAVLVVPAGTFDQLPAAAGAIGALLGEGLLRLQGAERLN